MRMLHFGAGGLLFCSSPVFAQGAGSYANGLVGILLLWVLILIGAVVAALLVERWWVRICLVLAALISMPAYVLLEEAVAHHAKETNWKEWDAWAEFCQLPPELKVHSTVSDGQSVNLRVRQTSNDMFRVDDPFVPLGVDKTVCWMELPAVSCTKATIANVQTEHLSTAFSCLNHQGDKRDNCHVMWNISVADQKRERVQQLTARYILDVHKPDQLPKQIERFRLNVVDAKTNKLLAETAIHRNWKVGANEGRQCPDRDVAIGKMLDAVFQGGSNAGR